jgi:hypothetical protein
MQTHTPSELRDTATADSAFRASNWVSMELDRDHTALEMAEMTERFAADAVKLPAELTMEEMPRRADSVVRSAAEPLPPSTPTETLMAETIAFTHSGISSTASSSVDCASLCKEKNER